MALLVLAPLVCGAEESSAHPAWLRTFYRTQDLRPFDGYWTEIMEQAVLADRNQSEPVIAFVSQLLKRNPGLVRTHFVALTAYPPGQREAVARILALSDTPEGRSRLREAGRSTLANRTPPPIAGYPVRDPVDLDFCWGWFFATGDQKALDPIVEALDLAPFAGGRERFATSARTSEDRLAARRDAVYAAATRSLTANVKADPFIARHVESLLRDPRTPPTRAAALAEILKAARL